MRTESTITGAYDADSEMVMGCAYLASIPPNMCGPYAISRGGIGSQGLSWDYLPTIRPLLNPPSVIVWPGRLLNDVVNVHAWSKVTPGLEPVSLARGINHPLLHQCL